MRLAAAKEAELPEIVDLINGAFRGSGKNASWNTEAAFIHGNRTTLALLKGELALHPKAELLAAHTGENLVGCVWLEPVTSEVWYLGTLAVAPQLQKAGVGRELLALAEKWVQDRGAKTVRMRVVNVRDTLIAWYLRRGYGLTGETEPFPYGDNRFGTPLRDDLNFVVLEKRW